MVIDAHVHIFPPDIIRRRVAIAEDEPYFALLYSSPKGHMATVEELLTEMGESGVSMAVAAGFHWNDNGLCRECNDYILDCCRRYPDRILGLAVANPLKVNEAECELTRALENRLAGIGELMPDGPGFALTDEKAGDVLAAIAETYNVPILTHSSEPVGHIYTGKGTISAAQIVTFAQRHPSLRLVCAHWGGGLPFYEMMPEVQKILANVYYDTAAWPFLYNDRIFSAAAILAPGKMIFATDYPLIRPGKVLPRIHALNLPASVQADLLSGTASKVYFKEG